jgi:hypothetical protein
VSKGHGAAGMCRQPHGHLQQRCVATGRQHHRTRPPDLAIAKCNGAYTAASVRLAGVYAVAGLADDWIAQRQVCINVLCAYLRMPYRANEESPGRKEGEKEVRATIVRVIRDHLRDNAPSNWHGHNLDFTGAVFDDANFSGTHFRAVPPIYGHPRRADPRGC